MNKNKTQQEYTRLNSADLFYTGDWTPGIPVVSVRKTDTAHTTPPELGGPFSYRRLDSWHTRRCPSARQTPHTLPRLNSAGLFHTGDWTPGIPVGVRPQDRHCTHYPA